MNELSVISGSQSSYKQESLRGSCTVLQAAFLTLYKDRGHDMSTKVKPEHLDGPLVAGGSTAPPQVISQVKKSFYHLFLLFLHHKQFGSDIKNGSPHFFLSLASLDLPYCTIYAS